MKQISLKPFKTKTKTLHWLYRKLKLYAPCLNDIKAWKNDSILVSSSFTLAKLSEQSDLTVYVPGTFASRCPVDPLHDIVLWRLAATVFCSYVTTLFCNWQKFSQHFVTEVLCISIHFRITYIVHVVKCKKKHNEYLEKITVHLF